MIVYDIKNSSGKITGKVTIEDNLITIDNKGKPILQIDDAEIIKDVLEKKMLDKNLVKMYNDYTLTTGEIAGLYNRCYSNINKILKKNPLIQSDHKGRRNRAYGHKVSLEQSKKMSQALKGRKAPTKYERTPEIKAKISNSLKKYFKEHPQNPEPHIENWKKGVYDHVNFQRGIAGSFTSIKTKQTFRFRSLLELYFALWLEKGTCVEKYIFEPFHIEMENGHSYMPDFLLNDYLLVELKSKGFIENLKTEENVQYKKEQAIKYCSQHNLKYLIVYDEDIGFKSRAMKAYIRNHPEILKKYNITFEQPERIWSQK